MQNITKTITMENKAKYVGKRVMDTLCLYDNDEICVMHFGFYDVMSSTAINNKRQDGVINFNQYGFNPDKLVQFLDDEEIFSNSTIQIDLSFPCKMFASSDCNQKSLMVFNGINRKNVKYEYERGQGVVWQ